MAYPNYGRGGYPDDWNQAEGWRGFGGRPGYGEGGYGGHGDNWGYDNYGGYQSGYNNNSYYDFTNDSVPGHGGNSNNNAAGGGYWGAGPPGGADAAGSLTVKPSLGLKGQGAGAGRAPGLLDYQEKRGKGPAGGAVGTKGLSSLDDLVNVAKDRTSELSNTPIGLAIRDWQACVKVSHSPHPEAALLHGLDEANVQNILCLQYADKPMCKIGPFNLHTGVLFVNNMFLARGVTTDEQSCRRDTYKKALNLLTTGQIVRIMTQEDIGEGPLGKEIQDNYEADPIKFMAMLEKSAKEYAEEAANVAMKRKGDHRDGGYGAKKGRKGGDHYNGKDSDNGRGRMDYDYGRMDSGYGPPMDYDYRMDSGYGPPMDYPGPRNYPGPPGPPMGYGYEYDPKEEKRREQRKKDLMSLVPKKNVGVILKQKEPLSKKLGLFNKLLKEEGITNLHIVPKIDMLAFKTAIKVLNVYRYSQAPTKIQTQNNTPTYVEIYFDNILMVEGDPDLKRNSAMHSAYNSLLKILESESPESIEQNHSRWESHMEYDAMVCQVIAKHHGVDNNALLTSNLANMRQMMQCEPDLSIPVDRIVITEYEADGDAEAFKTLELSATRNCMLLECEIVRESDTSFMCTMSLQGKEIQRCSGPTKVACKKKCADACMKKWLKKSDHVYVHKEYRSHTYTKSELVYEATKLCRESEQGSGVGPVDLTDFWKSRGSNSKQAPKNATAVERKRYAENEKEFNKVENLTENVALKPLMPWIAAAIYKIIDKHYQDLTLEDLLVDTEGMSRSQYELVTYCGIRMGLRVVLPKGNRNKGAARRTHAVMKRSTNSQDVHKMLQLCPGMKSGRYEMRRLVHKSSAQELAQFTGDHMARFQTLVEIRHLPFEEWMQRSEELNLPETLKTLKTLKPKEKSVLEAEEKSRKKISKDPLVPLTTGAKLKPAKARNNPRAGNNPMAVNTSLAPDPYSKVTTTNEANMRQMMRCEADLSIPVERLVVNELETDPITDGSFKCLELSATRSCMLLETQIFKDSATTFNCTIRLQGKVIKSTSHKDKDFSKRICAEEIVLDMLKNNDRIYVYKAHSGTVLTKAQLTAQAITLQTSGFPPVDLTDFHNRPLAEPAGKGQQEKQAEVDRIENLPENVALRPIMPWIAAALYQFLDDYFERMSLEDFMVDSTEMSKSQYDLVTFCATKMGLRFIFPKTKEKGAKSPAILRRNLNSHDVLKLLQFATDGKSGRYELKHLVHQSSPDELQMFRNEYLEKHKALVERRKLSKDEVNNLNEAINNLM